MKSFSDTEYSTNCFRIQFKKLKYFNQYFLLITAKYSQYLTAFIKIVMIILIWFLVNIPHAYKTMCFESEFRRISIGFITLKILVIAFKFIVLSLFYNTLHRMLIQVLSLYIDSILCHSLISSTKLRSCLELSFYESRHFTIVFILIQICNENWNKSGENKRRREVFPWFLIHQINDTDLCSTSSSR
jgi:hypothetical protein